MRPQVVAQTGSGTTNPIPVDRVQRPANISLTIKVNGTVSATVEFTTDDILAGETATWLPVTGMSALTVNTAGNIAFPIQALRLVNVGSGTATLTILQS